MKNKLILYIATSLDGFIAAKNGSVNFLKPYEKDSEDYGYKKFYDSVGTIIIGNKTYKQFQEPYDGKDCYVFSRKSKKNKGNIKYVKKSVKAFMKNFVPKDKKDIWIVGGANIANQFLKENLIDEMRIFIIPTLLGKGIPLFDGRNKEKI